MSSKSNKRSWHFRLLVPRFRFKTWSGIYMLTMIILGFLFSIALYQVKQPMTMLMSICGVTETSAEFMDSLMNSLVLFGSGAFVALLAWGIAIVVYVNHRFFAPMQVILDAIKGLQNGVYDGKRTLRSQDELKPIMDELNKLAVQLKNK